MDSAASDPFFLDWGSSVNVCEDLRRTIRSEINDIDTSITSLQSSIKTEERSSSQLTKDFSHAQSELLNLRRNAADDLDESNLNNQVQMRLRESLKKDVVSIVTPATSPSGQSASATFSNVVEKEFDDLSNEEKTKSAGEQNIAQYLSCCSNTVKKLSASIRKEKEVCLDMKSRVASLEDIFHSFSNRISKGDLIEAQTVGNQELEMKRKENEAEKRRIRCIKESIQQARKRSGDYAQKIADNTNILSSTKISHSSAESVFYSELTSYEGDISHLKSAELSVLEENMATVTGQFDNLIRQFAEREAILEVRETRKQEILECKSKLAQLQSQKAKMEKTVVEVLEKKVVAENRFLDASKKKAALETIRVENDKEEKEKLEPAKSKLPKLMEEKERLAGIITNLHEKCSSERDSAKETHERYDTILKKIRAELNKYNEELESKKIEKDKIEKLRAEIVASASSEIKDHEKFRSSFEEAMKAQQQRIKEQKELRKKMKEEKIAHKILEGKKNQDLMKTKLEILKRGVSIIISTEQMESQLRNTEICLNEKGEEIQTVDIKDTRETGTNENSCVDQAGIVESRKKEEDPNNLQNLTEQTTSTFDPGTQDFETQVSSLPTHNENGKPSTPKLVRRSSRRHSEEEIRSGPTSPDLSRRSVRSRPQPAVVGPSSPVLVRRSSRKRHHG